MCILSAKHVEIPLEVSEIKMYFMVWYPCYFTSRNLKVERQNDS